MGGAAYVNVYYNILNDENIEKNEKELSTNMCSIFNDTGKYIKIIILFLIKY